MYPPKPKPGCALGPCAVASYTHTHTRTCLYLSLSAGFDLWPETLQEDEVPLPDPDNLRAASLPVWHGRSLEGPSVQSAWYPGRADAPGQARGTLSRTGHLGLRPDSLTEGGLGTGSWRGLGPSKYFAHVVRETQAQGDMVPRDGEQSVVAGVRGGWVQGWGDQRAGASSDGSSPRGACGRGP